MFANGAGDREELTHGAVIVATGGTEHETSEYLCGSSSRVVTQKEFERMLHEGRFPAGKLREVVMVQCVGSREEGRMYCSRICCSKAVKNALAIREGNGDIIVRSSEGGGQDGIAKFDGSVGAVRNWIGRCATGYSACRPVNEQVQ